MTDPSPPPLGDDVLAYVRAEVDRAPALSRAQLDQLAVVLRPALAARQAPAPRKRRRSA